MIDDLRQCIYEAANEALKNHQSLTTEAEEEVLRAAEAAIMEWMQRNPPLITSINVNGLLTDRR